jgi:hypothetical protein
MKCAIAISCLLACKISFSQNWHSANDTLKEPRNPSGYYVSVAYFNRYDTVPCSYTVTGSNQVRKGFKFVYVLSGYYTDNAQTLHAFFDDRMIRVYNVDRFLFN